MSLFKKPNLKTEAVTVEGEKFALYELSAYDRVCYLEESDGIDFKGMGNGALLKLDLGGQISLIAYSLEPGIETPRDELISDLQRQGADVLRALYEPAAKLSGLWFDQGDEEKK